MGNSGRIPRQLTTVIDVRHVRGPKNGGTADRRAYEVYRARAERREA